jgi:hypothetical protein
MQHNAWPRVLQVLKSLASFHQALGESDQVLVYENKILYDIPYANSPQGFQAQQMLDVVLARVARKDSHQAQALLDQLKAADGAEKLKHIVDRVQLDIYSLEENRSAILH